MSGEDPIIAEARARNAAKEAATRATLARVNVENVDPKTLKEIAGYAANSGVTRSDPWLFGFISASYDVSEVRTNYANGELAGLSHEAQFTIGLLAGMKKEDIHITTGGGVKPIPRDKFSEGLEAALNLAEQQQHASTIFASALASAPVSITENASTKPIPEAAAVAAVAAAGSLRACSLSDIALGDTSQCPQNANNRLAQLDALTR